MTTIRTDYQQYLLQKALSSTNNTETTNSGVSFNQLLNASLYPTMPTQEESISLDDIFQQAALTYSVPVSLLKAVAKQESNFNPNAVSSAGAQGIMQLMPKTAAALGVSDSFDAKENIMGGAKYLAQMLTRFDNNVKLALAAYNAGAGNVEKYGGVPPFAETQNYVEKVLSYLQDDLSAGSYVAKDQMDLSELTSDFSYDDYLLFIQLINAWLDSSHSYIL